MSSKIVDLCQITTGKLDANAEVQEGQYPFYTCAEHPTTIDQYSFDDDVVLIAGNNASANFHLNRFSGKFDAYQRTYVLTAKSGTNLDYVFYSLKLLLGLLKKQAQGSQTKFLTRSILDNLEVNDLSKDKQQRITNILSEIDQKIELNNKINEELEKTAKLIYDYWFVQFDFPISKEQAIAMGDPSLEGRPYKSSSGAMVYNEKLKRDIPEGWSDTTVKDFEPNIVTGKTPSTKDPSNFGNDVPFVCIGDVRGNLHVVSTELSLSDKGANLQKNKYLPAGSICVTCIATVGLVAFAAFESQTNQQLNSIVCGDEQNKEYLFFSLKNFFKFSVGAKTGNTFANMNKGDFGDIKILAPCPYLVKSYHDTVAPMFAKALNNSMESKELKGLRDWLLPMLMNGQVSVSDSLKWT